MTCEMEKLLCLFSEDEKVVSITIYCPSSYNLQFQFSYSSFRYKFSRVRGQEAIRSSSKKDTRAGHFASLLDASACYFNALPSASSSTAMERRVILVFEDSEIRLLKSGILKMRKSAITDYCAQYRFK